MRSRLPAQLLLLIAGVALWLHVVASAAPPNANPPLPPLLNDALPPPALSLNGAPSGLSEYLSGRVSLLILLPESTGKAEPSIEDWQPAEIAAAEEAVRAAAAWWAGTVPSADLEFVVTRLVAETAYEPISHRLEEEELWLSDALATLGYQSGSRFERMVAALQAQRAADQSDWAVGIVIVDSSNDQDKRFASGHVAYAYVGGPLLVATLDAGSYGRANLAAVLAHELGHSFWALDQYLVNGVTCQTRSGYLDAPTSNSAFANCGTHLPSIMRDPLNGFRLGAVDPSARNQLGLRDSDGNGIIDVRQTAPLISATLAISTDGAVRVAGAATDQPFPSVYRADHSINTISTIEYRINNEAWQALLPQDGRFDQTSEPFTLNLPPPTSTMQLDLRARNRVGAHSARQSFQFAVGDHVGNLSSAALMIGAPMMVSTTLTLHLATDPAITMVQISPDPSFAAATWQAITPTLTFAMSDGPDGQHTIYLRALDRHNRTTAALPISVVRDTTAPTATVRSFRLPEDGFRVAAHDALSPVVIIAARVHNGNVRSFPANGQIITNDCTAHVQVQLIDGLGNHSDWITSTLAPLIYLPLVR